MWNSGTLGKEVINQFRFQLSCIPHSFFRGPYGSVASSVRIALVMAAA